jgi:hypothetical protein
MKKKVKKPKHRQNKLSKTLDSNVNAETNYVYDSDDILKSNVAQSVENQQKKLLIDTQLAVDQISETIQKISFCIEDMDVYASIEDDENFNANYTNFKNNRVELTSSVAEIKHISNRNDDVNTQNGFIIASGNILMSNRYRSFFFEIY